MCVVIQHRGFFAIFLWNPLYWNINKLWAFVGFRDELLVYNLVCNISLHSGLPSSILKVYFFGHLLWNWSMSHFPGLGLILIELGDGFQKTSQWSHPNPKRPWSLYPSSHFLPMFSLTLSLNPSWPLDTYDLEFISCMVLERACSNLIPVFFVLINLSQSFSVSYQCLLPALGRTYPLLHAFSIS